MAPLLTFLTLLVEASSAASNALTACPLLGQQYPPPVELSSNPEFQAVTKKLESGLIANAKSFGLNVTSLSIGMFSTNEEGLLYQFHNTDALVANNRYGTKKIDADSIYRIGSISKLFTMYMMLIADGDRHFNDPILEHVPDLQKDDAGWNSITPDWSEITIGDLAGQMAGLVRDYGWGDLSEKDQLPASLYSAFPKIQTNEVPTCGYVDGTTYKTCSTDEFLEGVANESPIFPTAYTPAYSNEAFALVALALQNIVNKQPEDIFNSAIVDALGLTGTSYAVPKSIPNTAVIPGTPTTSGWDADLGAVIPAAGYFSSTNDLATIGKAILNSTLISKGQTNRWLKPASFLESWNQGVGRPWEIFRTHVNGQAVDMYAKGGDWGRYSSLFALVPQYNFGFTILTASNPPTEPPPGSIFRIAFTEEVIPTILPVLDEIAKTQAASNFGGTYVDTSSNSSITITTDSANSGLHVTSWISNGVNVLKVIALEQPSPVYRLQPNQIDYGENKIGFTSFYTTSSPPNPSTGLVRCNGWDSVDATTDGNIPLGNLVFDVDSSGAATSVELRAMRVNLKKKA